MYSVVFGKILYQTIQIPNFEQDNRERILFPKDSLSKNKYKKLL